jgi:tetratricopeptide (TPR) repeat protein/TM2 domain-containing membrane protein YozV
MVAAARLAHDQPDPALDAARRAMSITPEADWSHRLASLALERLGRHDEAVAAAEDAVQLAPGSLAARLRLAAALRRTPGGWREAWAEAGLASRFAPDRPGPHLLLGDLCLLRGDHEQAIRSYRRALRRDGGHAETTAARVNLGLARLRWEPPAAYHDPAWPVDPCDTARSRDALVAWSRQVRLLLALAVAALTALTVAIGAHEWARPLGVLPLIPVALLTLRHARRVRTWAYLPAMFDRDPWLGMSVWVTVAVALAYAVAVAAGGPADGIDGALWAAVVGLALFSGVAMAVLRALVQIWRGRPLAALAEFAAADAHPTARRAAEVSLWLVAGRLWCLAAAPLLAVHVTGDPRAGLAALLVPIAFGYARLCAGGYGRAVAARDRGLLLAFGAVLFAAAALVGASLFTTGGAAPAAGVVEARLAAGSDGAATVAAPEETALSGPVTAALWSAAAALAAVPLAYAVRVATARWHGDPGATRATLTLVEPRGRPLPEDVMPSPDLDEQVRHAFTLSRGVVLVYVDESGPRALPVDAVAGVTDTGEIRLTVADEARQAAERDPRVTVHVTDPAGGRLWAEVRGVAFADGEEAVLRVTPTQVTVGEYPGRHQERAAIRG